MNMHMITLYSICIRDSLRVSKDCRDIGKRYCSLRREALVNALRLRKFKREWKKKYSMMA